MPTIAYLSFDDFMAALESNEPSTPVRAQTFRDQLSPGSTFVLHFKYFLELGFSTEPGHVFVCRFLIGAVETFANNGILSKQQEMDRIALEADKIHAAIVDHLKNEHFDVSPGLYCKTESHIPLADLWKLRQFLKSKEAAHA